MPAYYVPQVQYLLEIMELEYADFLQYRPAAVFGKETFVVVRVQRNRRWFQVYRPLIEEFLNTLRYYLNNPEALEMLKQEYDIKRTLFESMPLYKALWQESLVSRYQLDIITEATQTELCCSPPSEEPQET